MQPQHLVNELQAHKPRYVRGGLALSISGRYKEARGLHGREATPAARRRALHVRQSFGSDTLRPSNVYRGGVLCVRDEGLWFGVRSALFTVP